MEIRKQIEKWYEDWIAEVIEEPRAFDIEKRKNIALDQLVALVESEKKKAYFEEQFSQIKTLISNEIEKLPTGLFDSTPYKEKLLKEMNLKGGSK